MCTSAALERWQPAIASRPATSWYAVDPSASTRELEPFVLPAQRPASPEIAESPSATTAGVPTPGPSARAAPQKTSAIAHATTATRRIRLPPARGTAGSSQLELARELEHERLDAAEPRPRE